MMSLLARQFVSRANQHAYLATNRLTKSKMGAKNVSRRLSQIYSQRRTYTSQNASVWAPEDLSLLGSYKGTPTPRGIKKTSTGLTGLDVQPEAREVLIELYKKFAAELAKFPEDYPYRIDSELYIQRRLSILLEETDVLRLEEEMDAGQLETLISEAEHELSHVLPSYLELKPWAVPLTKWDKKVPYLYTDVEIA